MPTKNTAAKEKIMEDFKKLSRKRRKEVEEFISYLRIKEELEATDEVISDKDLVESIMRGEEDIKAGRSKKWEAVKRNV